MMKIALFTIGLLAVTAFGATGVAAEPNENATYGLCTAWNANENGRENGKAGEAPPFVWLQEQADDAEEESVEAYCDTVGHPSENGGGNGGGRP